MLYHKCLFPGTGSSGELCNTDVTHLLAYRIHIEHEKTAHFEICNRFQFCLTLFLDSPHSPLRSRSWNYSFPPCQGWTFHHGNSSMSCCRWRTHASQRCGQIYCRNQQPFRGLENKWGDAQTQAEAATRNTPAPKLPSCFNAVAYISSTGSRSF